MKPLSCPSHFILWQQGWSRTISRRKSYPINVLPWAFERLFVAVAATVYQEPHFWTRLRTDWKPRTPCISVLSQKNVHVWIHCNAWSNLTQEGNMAVNAEDRFAVAICLHMYSLRHKLFTMTKPLEIIWPANHNWQLILTISCYGCWVAAKWLSLRLRAVGRYTLCQRTFQHDFELWAHKYNSLNLEHNRLIYKVMIWGYMHCCKTISHWLDYKMSSKHQPSYEVQSWPCKTGLWPARGSSLGMDQCQTAELPRNHA